ncbi:MAG: hypothetical protein GC168_02735 [Candidatus Hydrogenedens sp.]|nr:hypothetical protein [Candidatus Hydrogenedens sp.]
MKLQGVPGAEPPPGDFGAQVTPGDSPSVEIPEPVLSALGSLSIRSAEELLSYADSFPTAIAASLGWSPQQVQQATQRLKATLHGFVPESLLGEFRPRPMSFGARPPEDPYPRG